LPAAVDSTSIVQHGDHVSTPAATATGMSAIIAGPPDVAVVQLEASQPTETDVQPEGGAL
jgi:hypothetical protein